jgi:hypothetical protein
VAESYARAERQQYLCTVRGRCHCTAGRCQVGDSWARKGDGACRGDLSAESIL